MQVGARYPPRRADLTDQRPGLDLLADGHLHLLLVEVPGVYAPAMVYEGGIATNVEWAGEDHDTGRRRVDIKRMFDRADPVIDAGVEIVVVAPIERAARAEPVLDAVRFADR